MKVALELGMPQFKIIEVPIRDRKQKKLRQKNHEDMSNLRKGGSIELFSNMNKEAIQMISKRQKINKSSSIKIRKFNNSGAGEAEAQLFQQKVNQKQHKKEEQKKTISQALESNLIENYDENFQIKEDEREYLDDESAGAPNDSEMRDDPETKSDNELL